MSLESTYKPIIIIGAARSGTNMLRDIISQLPDYGTWDCDEINPIWRHGNLSHPSDEFNKSMVTNSIKKFIRGKFKKLAKQLNIRNVVEKSCANSLRVSFIDEIFPDAKYVFIYRDGRDTVASAAIRYDAKFDLDYTLKKLKFVPPIDIPYYAYRFGWNRVKQLMGAKTLSFWGVQLNNMQELLEKHSLFEVCALQWKECVDKSLADFENISSDRIFKVSYENFVTQPKNELSRLTEFLGVNQNEIAISDLVKNVSSKSIGKFRKQLSAEEQENIYTLINDTLSKLDYSK